MAFVTPVELELLPVLAGALLYAVYIGFSAFRRSPPRQPSPDGKLAPDAKLATDVATATAASLSEAAQACGAEPCAEPCAEPAAAEDSPEPAEEPQGPSGSSSPRTPGPKTTTSSSSGAPVRKAARRLPPGALEARLAELEAQVKAAEEERRAPPPAGNLKQGLLCVAIVLWVGMLLVEQILGPPGSSQQQDAILDPAEPNAEFLTAATEPLAADLLEPAAQLDENTGPGAAELAAAGYSVDAGGLITLSLTRQHMTMQNQGEVTYHKSAYWGTVFVGSPPVPYKVVFDTGSGHLVLPSSYCHSETCRAHRRYRRSGSSSAKDIDYDGSIVQPGQPRDQITVSFGTGEVTGVFVEETVCVDSPGNDSASAAALPAAQEGALAPGCMKLRMIAATAMSEEPFKTFKFDGVLGLGLDGLSQSSEFNFITTVAKAMGANGGSRTPSTFAVFLGEHREESEITIGGWAQKHLLDDELVWRPVHDPELGHWLVQISALYVDNHRVSFCDGEEQCKAVVDTGTSLLAVPTPAFPELFELLRHQVSDDFECVGPGPSLHFEMGGVFNVTIEPQDYARVQELRRQSQPRHREEFGAAAPQEVTPQQMAYCKPMLMSLDLPAPIGPKLFILGEPVLRKYYTVYDAEAKRVGFGRAKHDAPPASREVGDDDDDWFFGEEEDEEE